MGIFVGIWVPSPNEVYGRPRPPIHERGKLISESLRYWNKLNMNFNGEMADSYDRGDIVDSIEIDHVIENFKPTFLPDHLSDYFKKTYRSITEESYQYEDVLYVRCSDGRWFLVIFNEESKKYRITFVHDKCVRDSFVSLESVRS